MTAENPDHLGSYAVTMAKNIKKDMYMLRTKPLFLFIKTRKSIKNGKMKRDEQTIEG